MSTRAAQYDDVEVTPEAFARFFGVMTPLLDERQRRLLAGAAADLFGRGGQAQVTEASGMSRSTVIAGMREGAGGPSRSVRVRAPGAGPKAHVDTQPGLVQALDEFVHPGGTRCRCCGGRRSRRPTTTETGPIIRAERDTEWYETGVEISKAEIEALPLTRHDWHGDWNYTWPLQTHDQSCGEPLGT